MKRISKVLLLGILSMVFAVSCNKDKDESYVTLNAYFEQPKVYLEPNGNNGARPTWHDGDAINVNGIEKLIEVDASNRTKGRIRGVEQASDNIYNAVYPLAARNDEQTNGKIVVVDIKSTQQYITDVNGEQIVEAPMVAVADENGNMYFKNTCALIKVVVTPQAGESVTAIKVQKVNPQSLTGTVTYNGNNGTFTYTPNALNANEATTITLTNIQPRTDNTYYVYVPFESGSASKYAVQVEARAGTTIRYYRAVTTQEYTFQRSKVYSMAATLGVNPFNPDAFTVSTTKKIVFNSGNYASTINAPIDNQLSLETSQYFTASDANAAISTTPSEWRLLTAAEWSTLIARRTPNGTLMYKAGEFTVGGQKYKGMLLFPDNIDPDLVDNFPSNNTLTNAQWQYYEANGAVFMRNALSKNVLMDYCQIWCGKESNPRQVDATTTGNWVQTTTYKVVRRNYTKKGTASNNSGGNQLVVDGGKGWDGDDDIYAAIRLVKEVTVTTVTPSSK